MYAIGFNDLARRYHDHVAETARAIRDLLYGVRADARRGLGRIPAELRAGPALPPPRPTATPPRRRPLPYASRAR